MTLKLSSPAEATLAIAAVAVGADGVGSMSERDFLYKNLKEMDVLKGLAPAEFTALLGSVTEKVYSSLPIEGVAISPKGIQMLVDAARSVLSSEQQAAALKMAGQLCASDGVSAPEKSLIQELEKGFARK